MLLQRFAGPLLAGLLFLPPAAGGILTLVQVQTFSGIAGEASAEGAEGEPTVPNRPLAFSADARHLYVGDDAAGSIVIMSRDATEETLTLVDVMRNGEHGVALLDGISGLAPSPNGRYLYATSQANHALTVFRRHDPTGRLAIVRSYRHGYGGVLHLQGPSAVAVSPSNRQVYVAARDSSSLAIFSRDATLDTFAFRSAMIKGRDAVDGLGGASSVAVSPDGTRVYVTGAADHALAVFSRDATLDALTFVEVHRDEAGGVRGIAGASDVAVSPDDDHVYVTGESGGTLAVFRRDRESGRLAFVESHRDGQGGVDGLDGARAVTVSPDGRVVVVSGHGESSLAAFHRDPETGRLRFAEVRRQGSDGITGLDEVGDIGVSPDGAHLFAASKNALSVFRVATEDESGSGEAGPGVGER